MRKGVEVSQDALGWLLLDADGHPVGEPDYYPTKRLAQRALRGEQVLKKVADVRLSLAEAQALLMIANDVLCDGSNGHPKPREEAARRALRRVVEVFGGSWKNYAGGIASTLHD